MQTNPGVLQSRPHNIPNLLALRCGFNTVTKGYEIYFVGGVDAEWNASSTMEVLNTASLEQFNLPPYPKEYEIGGTVLSSDYSRIFTRGVFYDDNEDRGYGLHEFSFETLQWTRILFSYTDFSNNLRMYGGKLCFVNIDPTHQEIVIMFPDFNSTKHDFLRLKLPKLNQNSCVSNLFVV